jgi:acetyl esterase/lipase
LLIFRFREARINVLRIIVVVVIVAIVAGIVALWPLRVLSLVTGQRGVAVRVDVPFGPLDSQRLDVYTPDNARTDAPVIVFFHGGGWAIGDKDEYGFVADALTRQGFVVVIPNYRLSPDVTFPAFVEDGADAVAWVAANMGGRPLFLAGHSAGAHIAALLNLDERYLAGRGVTIAGTIGLSGPYDFLPLTEERYMRVFPEATRDESQPIRFVDGTEPPMLLVTGDADRTVNPGNTTRLAAAITAKGGSATVKIYPGVGHLGTLLALARLLPWSKPPVVADIVAFVRAGADAAPGSPLP